MSDVNAISSDKLFSPSKLGSFKREFAKSVGRITLATEDFCVCWSFKSVFLAAELQTFLTSEFTFANKLLLQFSDHKCFIWICLIVWRVTQKLWNCLCECDTTFSFCLSIKYFSFVWSLLLLSVIIVSNLSRLTIFLFSRLRKQESQ